MIPSEYLKEYHKYNLDDFPKSLDRLEQFLYRRREAIRSWVAVFDIGTKAGRILIGNMNVPDGVYPSWNQSDFFNDGQVFNLGSDIDLEAEELPIQRSQGLKGIIFFINVYLYKLRAAGFNESNIVVVGTAAFRWMKNKREVIAHIKKQTGLELTILAKEDESRFSSLAILHTLRYDNESPKKIENIVLIDQGGGSTEISCFTPELSQIDFGEFYSINVLGTVALQTDFYTASAQQKVKPWDNQNSIAKQTVRLRQFIDFKLYRWSGFKSSSNIRKDNTVVYGMGSALTKCFGKDGSFNIHNKTVTVAKLEELEDSLVAKYGESNEQVRTLYSRLHLHHETRYTKNAERMRKDLVSLYGLPVYISLLQRLGLDEITNSGFGLRYGVYIGVFKYGIPLENQNDVLTTVELSELKREKIEELTLSREAIMSNLQVLRDDTVKNNANQTVEDIEKEIIALLREFNSEEKNRVLHILKESREGRNVSTEIEPFKVKFEESGASLLYESTIIESSVGLG